MLEKKIYLTLFLVISLLIYGCKGKTDTKKSLEEIRTGTQGISINFLANSPPDNIHVDKINYEFEIVLELKNKGAYPQPNEGDLGLRPKFGKIFLSGYDSNIISITPKEGDTMDFSRKTLDGKSTINPIGGQDIMSFKGTIAFDKLNVEKYEPTLLSTACYYYETTAGPSVCIDPNPYSTIKENKVCQVQDLSLSSQGAPIAVTAVNEEAFATKTQFRITIKNLGGGDVLKEDAAEKKCNPQGDPQGEQKISREDIDKIFLKSVSITNQPLLCGPFIDEGSAKRTGGGIIRLVNGEGFVICEYSDYANKITAYTTPLLIKLGYGYRNTAEKKITIKKEE